MTVLMFALIIKSMMLELPSEERRRARRMANLLVAGAIAPDQTEVFYIVALD